MNLVHLDEYIYNEKRKNLLNNECQISLNKNMIIFYYCHRECTKPCHWYKILFSYLINENNSIAFI